MKTFTYAGTARDIDGSVVFRATNRDGYAAILIKEGKTDVNIVNLPHAMSKDDAKKFLGYVDSKPAKAAKPQAETVAGIKVNPEKSRAVAEKTPEEIAAIRAKNLETIKAVGKRYDQMAERLAELED